MVVGLLGKYRYVFNPEDRKMKWSCRDVGLRRCVKWTGLIWSIAFAKGVMEAAAKKAAGPTPPVPGKYAGVGAGVPKFTLTGIIGPKPTTH